jgi:branched-chain amino acid transport system permease protein
LAGVLLAGSAAVAQDDKITYGGGLSLMGVQAPLDNASGYFSEQVVGVTEIVLALAMIAVLVWRPGGLFPSREVGTLLARRPSEHKDPP